MSYRFGVCGRNNCSIPLHHLESSRRNRTRSSLSTRTNQTTLRRTTVFDVLKTTVSARPGELLTHGSSSSLNSILNWHGNCICPSNGKTGASARSWFFCSGWSVSSVVTGETLFFVVALMLLVPHHTAPSPAQKMPEKSFENDAFLDPVSESRDRSISSLSRSRNTAKLRSRSQRLNTLC